jgi:hypothetical protein
MQWLGSWCDCQAELLITCSLCRKREATVYQSSNMKQYAVGRDDENWAYRINRDLPELCEPCDHRLWSS